MRSFASPIKFSLLTTASIVSFIFAGELSTQAATFSSSSASLTIDRFEITPENPEVDSLRDAIAFTGNDDSIAEANGDGTLEFFIDENNSFLDLDFFSSGSGSGSDYFSLGESSSLTSSTFFLESNETLSFDFTVSLELENLVDSELDGSVSTFSGVSFALFDDFSDTLLGEFNAIGNLDTNLTNGIDNDTIFATSNLNFLIDSFAKEELFDGDREFASIDITGNIQQTVTIPTQIRLQTNSFNLSCTQATQSNNPCLKAIVSEPDRTLGLIVAFLGFALLSQQRNKKLNQ